MPNLLTSLKYSLLNALFYHSLRAFEYGMSSISSFSKISFTSLDVLMQNNLLSTGGQCDFMILKAMKTKKKITSGVAGVSFVKKSQKTKPLSGNTCVVDWI